MNTYICKICNRQLKHEITLDCGHIYCFSCLKSSCKNNGLFCPQCHKEIPKNMLKVTSNEILNSKYEEDIYWLYSSGYNSEWWCYDIQSNYKLEMIYEDFLKMNKTSTKDDIGINLKQISKNVSPNNAKKSFLDYSLVQKMELYNSGFEDFNNVPKNNKTCKVVMYKSHCEQKKEDNVSLLPMPYKLKIGKVHYIINFNKMKQINQNDIKRQRNIMRVLMPKNITDRHKYLETHHKVKGVSGIKYR